LLNLIMIVLCFQSARVCVREIKRT
jgi:hypothetical protein